MSATACRALLVSAPASGQGKTTVTAALARRARQTGLRARVFKVGPDFIDPMILQQASGAPVHQLDLWMLGELQCQRLLYEAAQASDLILIEGYKFERFPKIEVYRADRPSSKPTQPPLFLSDPDIVAIAADKSFVPQNGITLLDINDIQQISQFIIQHFSLKMPR
mgnify:CR=1 FL=1